MGISASYLPRNSALLCNISPTLIFSPLGLLSTHEGYHLFLGPLCLSWCWAHGKCSTGTQLIEEFVPRTTAWTVFPGYPALQILGIERSVSEQPHSGPLGWASLGRAVLHESLANLRQLLNGNILELWLRWAQAVMAGSPSNSHSDNYTGFKLFSTLHPQSNFRINLRFDRELVAVSRRLGITCWACLALL